MEHIHRRDPCDNCGGYGVVVQSRMVSRRGKQRSSSSVFRCKSRNKEPYTPKKAKKFRDKHNKRVSYDTNQLGYNEADKNCLPNFYNPVLKQIGD